MYYPVRKGREIRDCLFFSWDACAAQLQDCDDAEFEVFSDIREAEAYLLRMPVSNLVPNPQNAQKEVDESGKSLCDTGIDPNEPVKRGVKRKQKKEEDGMDGAAPEYASLETSDPENGQDSEGGESRGSEDVDDDDEYFNNNNNNTPNPTFALMYAANETCNLKINDVLCSFSLTYGPNFDDHPGNVRHFRLCRMKARIYCISSEKEQKR